MTAPTIDPTTTIFTFDGNPQSKARPSFAVKNGKVMTFTPKTTRLEEKRIATLYRAAGLPKFVGDISVSISFHAETRRGRDIDNMIKLVLDALQDEAYGNDTQVVGLHAALTRGVGAGNGLTQVMIVGRTTA